MNLEGEFSNELRGVRNPKVIDLITPGSKSDTVVLKIIEDRPWNSDPNQLAELGEKFNNYLDYVLDGWFIQQYPAYQGKKVSIELTCLDQPSGDAEEMINQIRRYALNVGLEFELSTQGSQNFL